MKKPKHYAGKFSDDNILINEQIARLKQKAEKLLSEPKLIDIYGQIDEIAQLHHDLQVHKIELELQLEELQESNNRLLIEQRRSAQLYFEAPVGYLTMTPQGNILRYNKKSNDIFGISDYQMLKPIFFYLEPKTKEVLENHLYILQKVQPQASCELFIRHTPKGDLWIRMDSSITQEKKENGAETSFIQSVIFDISETKQLMAELAASQSEMKSMLNELPVGVILINQSKEIVYTNQAIMEISGYQPHEVLEKPCNQLFAPLNEQECFKCSVTRKTYQEECFLKTKTSKPIPGLRSLIPLNIRNIPHLLCTFFDIREQKNLTDELTNARDRAESALKAKANFLASMSHEIRTPMNAIIGMTDLALMSHEEEEKLDYLTTIKSSANHLLGIINDILDLSKIDSGKILLDPLPFNLNDLLRNTLSFFKIKSMNKDIDIQIVLSSDLPRQVIGDQSRIQQILVNLVSNALKFTEKGTIIVSVERYFSDLMEEQSPQSNMILFTVKDEGIGIPLEKQNIIFEMFSQADQSISRKYGGTGLGLAISKKLVQIMGGEIWLKSTPGNGSTFFFTLPLAPVEQKANSNPSATQKKSTQNSHEWQRVLLVEDNKVNIKLASVILKKIGFSCSVTENGQAALDFLLSDDSIDFILMDIEMPIMDGITATKKIREGHAGENYTNIPIIALTAHAVSDILQTAISAGMNGSITKPFDILTLETRIKAILNSSRTIH